MKCFRSRGNLIDDTTFEFGHLGFWLTHLFGAMAIFYMGMRFVMHRAPLSIVAYRMLKRLGHR